MHGPYLNPACIICTVGKQSAVDGRSVAAVTNKKVPCVLKLEPSPLQLPTLHSSSSPALPCHALHLLSSTSIFRRYLNVHLKLYDCKHGRWYTHTSVQCSPASEGLTQACPNYAMHADHDFRFRNLAVKYIIDIVILQLINVFRVG